MARRFALVFSRTHRCVFATFQVESTLPDLLPFASDGRTASEVLPWAEFRKGQCEPLMTMDPGASGRCPPLFAAPENIPDSRLPTSGGGGLVARNVSAELGRLRIAASARDWPNPSHG
jgi:hypothetical protein